MDKGLIGGGWRLFVEFDSYAIAFVYPRLPTWAGGGNSMGLIHEARGPIFLFLRSVAWTDGCSLHILTLEKASRGRELAGSHQPGPVGWHVHMMIDQHRVKH